MGLSVGLAAPRHSVALDVKVSCLSFLYCALLNVANKVFRGRHTGHHHVPPRRLSSTCIHRRNPDSSTCIHRSNTGRFSSVNTPAQRHRNEVSLTVHGSAGFRHDSLHELPAAASPPPDGRGPSQEAAAGLQQKGMARIASCPGGLSALSAPALIKPEYSHRNHKQFLDLYDLGAVLGTGGYAVVRECTCKATGAKFAAKMMTVSEHPESGGRDIDRQVHAAAAHEAHAWVSCVLPCLMRLRRCIVVAQEVACTFAAHVPSHVLQLFSCARTRQRCLPTSRQPCGPP